MNRLLACRVCLAYDTPLCSIMDDHFRDIYEKMVEASLDTEDMLPTSVCNICFFLMKKMLQFRDMSLKTNQILQQMISSGLELSVSSLDILVKDQIGISWTLGLSNIVRTSTSGQVGFKVKIEPVESEMDIDIMSDRNEDYSDTMPVCRNSTSDFEGDLPLQNISEQCKTDHVKILETPKVILNAAEACRVCLAYDTRLCSIMDGQFRDIYEKLVEASLDTEDMLPTSVCYICFSLMQKMLQFRDMSLKTNQILQQMISSGLELSVSSLDILVKDQIGISWNLEISDIVATTITSGQDDFKVKIEPVESEMDIDKLSDWNEGAATLEEPKLEKNEAENGIVSLQTPLIKTEKDEEPRENTEDKRKIFFFKEVEMATSNIINGNQNLSVFNKNDTVTPPKDFFSSKILFEFHMEKSHVMEFTRKVSIISDLNVTNECKSNNLLKAQEIQNKDNRKEKDLTTHVRVQNKEKPFKCDICKKSYTQRVNLVRHLRVHTKDNPLKCALCEKGFSRSTALTRHLRIHNKEKPFKCDICEKSFTQRVNLGRHLRIHTKEKPFKCVKCERGFSCSSDLTRHLRVHTNENPFKCAICKKGFSFNTDLTRHLRTHTKEKSFKCDICKQGFYTSNALTRHLKGHTKEMPFKCARCEEGFSSITELSKHLRAHTKGKSYKCEICKKCFTDIINLNLHLKVHTLEKLFKCDICEKSFAYPGTLTRHVKVHTKVFKCDICEKSFASHFTLTRHIQVHTKKKPLKCD